MTENILGELRTLVHCLQVEGYPASAKLPARAASEIVALRAERDRLREVVLSVEWSDDSGGYICCPVCKGAKWKGHAPDCALAATLGQAK